MSNSVYFLFQSSICKIKYFHSDAADGVRLVDKGQSWYNAVVHCCQSATGEGPTSKLV